ncbi:TraB/GumN family protein [bacterium]|nr:TraB/GumN family protein [bacterium]
MTNHPPVRRTLVLGLLLALLSTPSLFAQAAANAAPGKVFLWRVERADGGTAYLLGSVHAATASLYPLDRRIEDAYGASDALVVEANLLAADPLQLAAQLIARAAYPAGDALAGHVNPDQLALIGARLETYGLSLDAFRQLKPWYIGMAITMLELQKLDISPEHGIDIHFLKQAMGAKPILELEGPSFQIDLLDSLTDQEQALFLEYTLKDLDQLPKYMKDLLAAWTVGDAEKLAGFLRQALKDTPAMAPVYRKLFDDRNVRMAEKIEQHLGSGQTCFVVVGAGHIVGPNGLLDLLGKKHTVRQVGEPADR